MMDEYVIELVLARLDTMSDNLEVHFGGTRGTKGYVKEDLINSVKKQDSLGKKIVKKELEYLRMLRNF